MHFKETEKEFNHYKFSKVNALKGGEQGFREGVFSLFSTGKIKPLLFNVYLPTHYTYS